MVQCFPEIFEFLKRIEQTNNCWIWKGTISTNGYGRFSYNYKEHMAHRFSYELFRNDISDKLVIDHLCRNRKCVNPDHLEVVTHRVNILRGIGTAAINSRKTHCIHGHEFTSENTLIINTRNIRRCKKCTHLISNKWHQNHKEIRNQKKRAKYACKKVLQEIK